MSERLIQPTGWGWETTTLGALCASGGGDIQTGPFGSQLHASDYVRYGIPSVMPQNIGDNMIREEGIARITSTDAARLSRYLLKSGDVVYSRRGDVTRRALIKASQEGWLCGTGCLRIRIGASANSRFISYYLGHPSVREWIERHAIGATMPNLNTKILSALPVTYPPRSEQDAVAKVLGALDDKIAINERIVATASLLAETIFREAASRAVYVKSLGDLIELRYGRALPKSKRIEGGVPVFGSGGYSGNHNRALVQGPGIIIGRKGTVGAVYWCETEFFPIDTTFYVAPKGSLPLEFIFLLLRTLGLEHMNSDSAVPGLNRNNALSLQVRVPDAQDLNSFYDRVSPLFRMGRSRQTETNYLVSLRDALLPKLMSGEIRVRNAEKVVEEAV